MAKELRSKGINVNAVLPSIIDTPVNRADMPDADFSEWVQPAAIADVILFLHHEPPERDEDGKPKWPEHSPCTLIVDKHRQGDTGDVEMIFHSRPLQQGAWLSAAGLVALALSPGHERPALVHDVRYATYLQQRPQALPHLHDLLAISRHQLPVEALAVPVPAGDQMAEYTLHPSPPYSERLRPLFRAYPGVSVERGLKGFTGRKEHG